MSEALFYANALEVSDKNPALINVNNRAAAELRRLHAENEALKVELHEQARVNGMGGEREASLMAELERKSDAIQRLWKERDELRALNAELVEALRGTVQEMISVVASLNAEQMPHDGDEFHERLEKARAALAKVEASK